MESALPVLRQLPDRIEPFLAAWIEGMRAAGYLEHTTAKREDCILSFQLFVQPMLQILEAYGRVPEFAELLESRQWCEGLLETARRHRSRGLSPEMFLGCFKTMVHAVADQVADVQGSHSALLAALRVVQRFADACETILVADWAELSQQAADERLGGANRLLTLEKNKYENILAAISDLVLVVGKDGAVLETNQTARDVFGKRLNTGSFVGQGLGLEGGSMEDVLRYYPPGQAHEVSSPEPQGDGTVQDFALQIIPLSLVSLASEGYILVLGDITAHVRQRAVLERLVGERTEALHAEKTQLQEMNITLRHVMNAVEKDRESDRRSIAHTVETVLLPALERIRQGSAAEVRKGYIDILEDQLVKLAPGVGPDEDARLLKLTPMEMKICQFIRAGNSTKDIAEAMHLAPGTVQTHRKNIRKKLKIRGRDINLYTYLQSARLAEAPSPHVNG